MLTALLLLAQAAAPSLAEAYAGAVGCARTAPGEIVVCRRAAPERAPATDPAAIAGSAYVDARDRAIARPDAAVGTCSPIGAGGATGCALREAGAWGEADRVARRARHAAPR